MGRGAAVEKTSDTIVLKREREREDGARRRLTNDVGHRAHFPVDWAR
jgi:hypothetical protein